MISGVAEARRNSDDRVPAHFRPIGPEVEVARDDDWTVTVSRSQDDGFCISQAHSGGGHGVSTGHLPQSGDRSQHVVAITATTARKNSVRLATGLVTSDVARVQAEFPDGTSVSVQTEAASALDADLRTFAISAPVDGEPLKLGPDFPPLVSAYVLFASDGTVLERLESPRR